MKEDNVRQSGDYDAPFYEEQYTHGSCYITLFKFKSFDQLIPLQTASNFRHLLSCGTIVSVAHKSQIGLCRFERKTIATVGYGLLSCT